MDQSVLDRAVKMATRMALNGYPVAQIVWVPPFSGADDPGGSFVVVPCPPLTAGSKPPWE